VTKPQVNPILNTNSKMPVPPTRRDVAAVGTPNAAARGMPLAVVCLPQHCVLRVWHTFF